MRAGGNCFHKLQRGTDGVGGGISGAAQKASATPILTSMVPK